MDVRSGAQAEKKPLDAVQKGSINMLITDPQPDNTQRCLENRALHDKQNRPRLTPKQTGGQEIYGPPCALPHAV
jgi:hypothetical protein